MSLIPFVKKEWTHAQEPSLQKVISLSSAQIEIHDVHCDLDMEKYPATNPEVFMTTLLSSIPSVQGFPNMLGLPYFE